MGWRQGLLKNVHLEGVGDGFSALALHSARSTFPLQVHRKMDAGARDSGAGGEGGGGGQEPLDTGPRTLFTGRGFYGVIVEGL